MEFARFNEVIDYYEEEISDDKENIEMLKIQKKKIEKLIEKSEIELNIKQTFVNSAWNLVNMLGVNIK